MHITPIEKTFKGLLLLAGLLVALICPVHADQIQEVNSLLDQVEVAWAQRDAEALAQCYSEHLLLAVDPPGSPSGAAVFDKEKAIKSISMRFKSGKSPSTHQFVKRDIMIEGDALALIRMTALDRWDNGRSEITTTLGIACREGDTWRMCFGFPMFYQPAVLVTDALAGSQAERMGIRPGDAITHYAGQKIEVDSQLVELVQASGTAGDGADIQLGIMRGREYLQLVAAPGPLGVKMETRLLPDDGANMIGADEQYPIKETAERVIEAVRAQDMDAFLAEASSEGMMEFASPDGNLRPVRITDSENGRKRILETWNELSLALEPQSLRSEESRAIVKGNLGLLASRCRFRARKGNESRTVNLLTFVRRDGRWRLFSALPLKIDIGLDPPLEINVTPEELARIEEGARGSFAGVGLQLAEAADGVQIKAIIPHAPADKAGLAPGDVITEINSLPTKHMKLGDAVKLLRGPIGTVVHLVFLSPGSESSRHVSLARDTIVPTTVSSEIVEPGIGLIVISRFTEHTPASVRRALESHEAAGVQALILDLTENTGGFYPALCEVAGIFVGQEQPLWLVRKPADQQVEEIMSPIPLEVSWPLVVLVGPQTTGGELVAAAIKDSGRARLLGQTTPGLAILRKVEEQPDGSSRKVVLGRFLRPGDKTIYGHGVEPDEVVDTGSTREEVLRRAAEVLKEQMAR